MTYLAHFEVLDHPTGKKDLWPLQLLSILKLLRSILKISKEETYPEEDRDLPNFSFCPRVKCSGQMKR